MDQPGRAVRGRGGAPAQALGEDDRGAGGRLHSGEDRVEPADAGVAEAGALFLVPVDLDDGVVHVQEHIVAIGFRADQRAQGGETDQEPGRDRVQLTHLAKGERAQERPER